MIVDMNDVHTCLDILESGKEFVFVFETNGFRLYKGVNDNIECILVILTPEWYDLVYCSNGWDDIVLQNELMCFYKAMKKLNDDFISTKFTVVWR